VFVLKGAVPTLIDSGHPDPACQAHLDRGLADLGLRRADLAQVLYTHTHLDHMGGGVLAWGGDALRHVRHRASRGACAITARFGAYTHRLHRWEPWLRSLPDHPIMKRLWNERDDRHRGPRWLQIADTDGRAFADEDALSDGDVVLAGDRAFRVFDVHGHDPFHVAFADDDLLISGDVLLSAPTPLVPPMDDDAVAYGEALDRLAEDTPPLVLPAHGMPRSDGPAFAAAVRARFHDIDAAVLAAAQHADDPHPASVLAQMLDDRPDLRPPGDRLLDQLLANVHSHLERAVRLGRAERTPDMRYEA
jgi:glyoxylase-like metal-dependent hydrolase (beta-lactamase superfamily II)